MKPFCIFTPPDNLRWLSRPKGRKRYRIDMWAKETNGEEEKISITPKTPCTISELFPEVDKALAELLEDKELIDYGFKAYVWG